MKARLVSLIALLFTVVLVNNAVATNVAVERSETVQYNTVAGKSFAVDLRAKIKTLGTYSLVNTSSWLQISEEGILFGTPVEANIGDHKLFVSIKKAKMETLVRVLVHVADPNTPPTFSFVAKANEIFKMDLAVETGIKGTYTYSNLPAWLEGLETGVIVGMPETADLGAFTFDFTVKGLDKGLISKATIEVKAEPTPAPATNAFLAKVGQYSAINLYSLTLVKGNYTLTHVPAWLTLDAKGWLSGIPTEADRGESYVSFTVDTPEGKYGFMFKTLVE